MFSELTNWILELIRSHGILAVILGVVIETIIVPIPSPLILMFAGFVLIPKGTFMTVFWSALWISVVAGLAQTIGSYMLFFIGYYGGQPVLEIYEKYHGVSWKEINTFQKKFSKGRKEDFTLFVLRALPIMPLSVVSLVAGVMEMNVKRYSIATFFGVVPRNLLLALLGFSLKGGYEALAHKIDYAETIMTVILVLLIIAYIICHKIGLFDKLRKHIFK